ncbi:2-oxoglutarate dehydrogenase complex dihydrolipoyllysine-residue succinyltransferase [Candidatus Pelagibacter sp.]|nr:2-oxoglutarate dehydrogenase complex dihydrolipoyllysine-residue succinyltransferase [Candidatus Pelagibacter sp.]MDA9709240.1 2-oxoglutarate dehydrogenase complex dihydrolipoyllysine-residue succinyltransferase [Candidatus Pelagibacter sp.]|tara:strand:+ start:77 stop:1387 length:1311 start_codon:yes stop_codon:yes gene_type:complete
MSENILVPVLGESVTEATVARWLKKEGEHVAVDEPVVELETDKVNLEVPSPVSGVIEKINSKDGENVEVGSVLGTVSNETKKKEKNENVSEKIPPITEKIIKEAETAKSKEPTKETEKEAQNETSMFENESEEEAPLILTDEVKNGKSTIINKHLSPAVRKIVNEQNIKLEGIKGSGKNGTILKGDLLKLMSKKPEPNQRKVKYGPEERIKMTRLRQTIAKRLKSAQENAAMLTTFNEVDMSEIISFRKNNQDEFQKKFGVKLGFMSFFVKASVKSLKSYPAINAEIENDDIIYKNYFNISFAVGTDKGLVVPVLKNADEMSFSDIESEIKNLSEKANNGNLSIEDLQGGTFTISNGGVYGSMLSTPILNPPQSGVLGMHNIVERPVVVNNEIKIRPIMYLALSYDHRIIDGKEAVSFLKEIKQYLEDPEKLFLEN